MNDNDQAAEIIEQHQQDVAGARLVLIIVVCLVAAVIVVLAYSGALGYPITQWLQLEGTGSLNGPAGAGLLR